MVGMRVAGEEHTNSLLVRVRRGLTWLQLTNSAQQEIAALDGLRALAVVLVVWCHIYRFGTHDWPLHRLPFLTGIFAFGFIGVLLFFALSGFLLFLPYARALMGQHPWPDVIHFYRRRALRIMPLYYALLVLMGVGVILAGHPHIMGWSTKGLLFDGLFLQNFSSDAAHLNQEFDNASLWTLAIEWQFYLLLPWLALGIAKLCRLVSSRQSDTGRIVTCVTVALCGLIICGIGVHVLAAFVFYGNTTQVLLLGRGWFDLGLTLLGDRYLEDFALGMLLSVLYALALERGWLTRHPTPYLGGIAAIVAAGGLILSYQWAYQEHIVQAPSPWFFSPTVGWSWEVFGEWITTGCFTLLVGSVLFGPAVLRWIFSLAPLRWIGVISYSLYLWHLPVIGFVSNTGAALVIMLLLSVASYYLIERPFLRRRYAQATKKRGIGAQRLRSLGLDACH